MPGVIAHLRELRVAAVVQAPRREDLIARALSAAEGGVKILALPVSVPYVAEIAAEIADGADVRVALCDVVHVDHVSLALAAGAELVLSPIFDPELVELARARGLEVIPGATSTNEVRQVSSLHSGPIAIVPCEGLGGPPYLGLLHRVFPDVPFVAVGGVPSDGAPSYLEHGACAVVVDRGLFPPELEPESAAVIVARASALVELCAAP